MASALTRADALADDVVRCDQGRLTSPGAGVASDPDCDHGGRGVYFDDPAGHHFELITQPYGADL